MMHHKYKLCIFLYFFGVVLSQNCRRDGKPIERKCEALCYNGTCEIRAAVMLPANTTYMASLPAIQPVFELAESSILRNALLPKLKFKFIYIDDGCDSSYALIGAIDAYTEHCPHVYFGPTCEYALAPVGRIVRFLGHSGTPLITVGGLSYDFLMPKTSCKDEFYMMSRTTMVGFKDIAYFLIEIMRHYGWKQLFVICESDGQLQIAGPSTCFLMMKTLLYYLKQEQIQYSTWDTTADVKQTYTEKLRLNIGFKYTNFSS